MSIQYKSVRGQGCSNGQKSDGNHSSIGLDASNIKGDVPHPKGVIIAIPIVAIFTRT